MTWADRSRLDELREAVRQSDAGGDSHAIPPDRPPIESDADAKTPAWAPFPVEALPEPMRSLVIEGAKAIGCNASMVALPALAVCGAAIGGSRAVELKPGWVESPTIWAGVVVRSGSAKSPAARQVLAPVRKMEKRAYTMFLEQMDEYKVASKKYKKLMAKWNGDGVGPVEPEHPIRERFTVSDVTIEALAPILQENPRGVLLARDEIGGWLKSFGQYKNGKGGDAESWLSIFDSDTMMVDRKTSRESILVDAPHVCITGTIQPGALVRALGEQYIENGLVARLLLVMPPAKCPPFSTARVSGATTTAWATCIENLCSLEAEVDDDDTPAPIIVAMSPEASKVWIALHDELAERITDADDRLAAALSKLRAYAARLALIHHLTAQAGRGAALRQPTPIGVESAEAGCALARWFANEIQRVYDLLDAESDDHRERRRLIEWIAKRGGSVTVRDLQHSSGERFPRADDARAALEELVKAGLGNWSFDPPPKGGGPQRERFTLTNATAPTNDKRGDSDP